MLAYHIQPEGFGFTTDSDKFFWNRVSAGKFCERQLADHLRSSVRKYTERAEYLGGYYNTIRKYNALINLHSFILDNNSITLPELANQVLALEDDMRAIIPSKQNPHRNTALTQVNDLVWLCVRIRKQFKSTL